MDDRESDGSLAADTSISAVLRGADRALVTVTGALDEDAVRRLKAILRGLCAAGALYVVVDLAGVTDCARQARTVLSGTRRRLAVQHGWLLLLTPPAQLADLDTASLADLFVAYRQSGALRGELLPASAV